jgi:Tol biopolymer transport system component
LFHTNDAGPGSDEPALIIPDAASPVELLAAPETKPIHTKLLLCVIAAACVLGIIFFILSRSRRPDSLAWHSVPFTISSGYQSFPDFSPDGKRVAFTWAGPDDGPRQVYLQTVGSFTPKRLTDTASEAIRPAWSPDGRQIAYLQMGAPGRKDIYTIAPDGGVRRKLASLKGSDPWLCNEARLSWSPTGKVLASVEENELDRTCGVVLIDLASGSRRWLTHSSPGRLADLEPAFSPDGKSVAFLRQSSASIGDIFVVPVSGGEPRRLTFDNREVRGFGWSRGGGLIVSSRRKGNFLNLWRMPLGTGTPVSLTESPLNLGFPSVSAAGDRLAYVAYRDDSNIWRFDGSSNRSWIESSGTDSSACYSPDGRKIAFVSDRAGNLDLWIADADGRNPARITDYSIFPVGSPAWSPDCRRLAFDLRVAGQSHIYMVEAEPGHQPRRLTTWQSNEAIPGWSSDGQFVYFASRQSGVWNVYRVAVSGGKPAQVTRKGGFRPLASPDGRFLYFTKSLAPGIWRLPLKAAGPEEPVLADFPALLWSNWTLGPRGLYFFAADPAGKKAKPAWIELLESGQKEAHRLGSTERAPNDGLSVSPDGKLFLYSQVDRAGSDILLLEH